MGNYKVLQLEDLVRNYPLDNGYYSVQIREYDTNVIKDITNEGEELLERMVNKSNTVVFMMTEGHCKWFDGKPSESILEAFVKGSVVEDMLDVKY